MKLGDLLKKCDSDSFRTVVNAAIDGLCNRAGTKADNLSNDEFTILSNAVKSAVESILKYGLNPSQVPHDDWTNVDQKFIETIHHSLKQRPEDVRQIKLGLLLSRNGPYLQNFDWNVKWVLGSNSLSSLEEPLANLQLILSDGSTHCIEMNKSELNNFIEKLEPS